VDERQQGGMTSAGAWPRRFGRKNLKGDLYAQASGLCRLKPRAVGLAQAPDDALAGVLDRPGEPVLERLLVGI